MQRHPHVFPDGELDGVRMASSDMNQAGIGDTWERLKSESRQQRQQHGALDDVPHALPAIQRAQKLQRRAARVGFDWPDATGPQNKLHEEAEEFAAALRHDDAEQIEHELGDLIFTCVNLARHHDIDAEQALARANRRFETRFASMEADANNQGRALEELSLQELEALWLRAKRPLPA